jgi:hypothetical protein
VLEDTKTQDILTGNHAGHGFIYANIKTKNTSDKANTEEDYCARNSRRKVRKRATGRSTKPHTVVYDEDPEAPACASRGPPCARRHLSCHVSPCCRGDQWGAGLFGPLEGGVAGSGGEKDCGPEYGR